MIEENNSTYEGLEYGYQIGWVEELSWNAVRFVLEFDKMNIWTKPCRYRRMQNAFCFNKFFMFLSIQAH